MGGERARRFEALYRRHERRVLGYALRRAPAETAQDAVAEAFLAAWRRLDELPADPLPWLIAATRRTLANQRRSAARQARLARRLASAEVAPGPAGGGGLDPALAAAFRELTAADREALALVAWDGLTPTQAARSLGCSPATFRVRLHRARRRLEGLLAAEEEAARGPGCPKLKEVS